MVAYTGTVRGVQSPRRASESRSMRDYFAPVQKPFDYAAFIEQLMAMVDRARAFTAAERYREDAAFRKWKHEVEDLIARIVRLRYDVNTKLNTRQFQVLGYGSYSKGDQQKAFNKDLDDTVMELDVVIENYKRHGDPKADKIRPDKGLIEANAVTAPAAEREPLKPPEKVTFKWLWEHMSITVGGTLMAAMGIAFTAGITVGNWTSVQGKFATWAEKTASPTFAAPTAPVKPASK